MTQSALIVAALRKRPHTTWQLSQLAGSTCPWKRITEAEERGYLKPGERILRASVERAGKRVTLYTLVRQGAA